MLRRMTVRFLGAGTIGACAMAIMSCAPSATEGGFDAANPAARMYAIEQAAREGDSSSLRDIIEELDSDDPAVRLLAIEALQRLTGRTYGYLHYDPPAARDQAVRRWMAAADSGELDDLPQGAGR